MIGKNPSSFLGFLHTIADCISMCLHLFQLNLVITSIIILCVIAMLLYGILSLAEKHYLKRL